MLRRWVDVGMNMLFPQAPRCAACQGPLEREGVCLCLPCVNALPLIRGPVCTKCGQPLPDGCGGCEESWAFAGLRALGLYQGALQEMIHWVKYQGKRELGLALGELLAGPVREEELLRSCSVIAWVPLHPNRMARRGFDQGELLARGLARQLGRRLLPRSTLIRWRDTPSQTRLDRMERWQNVDGAFRVEYPQRVRGKAVLLVDDVLTTGATCHAAASALLAAGALRVGVCVVALSNPQGRGRKRAAEKLSPLWQAL
ncbi:MAG: phosphoribosyltransferase family protein [Limnochordia bacterium]|jgi:ComF family protein